MEILRYVIVFFTVGWGGGLIGGILFLLTMRLFSPLRGTNVGRALSAFTNGVATCLAVILAFFLCRWTGGEAKLAMFGLAFAGMVLNDRWRIRRARTAYSIAGQVLADDPVLRTGCVRTERMNMVADIAGFFVALGLLPKLAVF